jgi:hypothetical protein
LADIVAKSFWGGERKFSEPLMWFVRANASGSVVHALGKTRGTVSRIAPAAVLQNQWNL